MNKILEHPATRVVHDSHALMHEDKFDTWLDITGLFEFRDLCATSHHWGKSNFRKINKYISADSIAELQVLGLKPYDLSFTIITPLLPALILMKAVRGSVSKCHLNDTSIRNHLKIIKESSGTAISLQVAHLISHTSPTINTMYTNYAENWLVKVHEWPTELLSAFYLSEDMMMLLRIHKEIHRYSTKTSPRSRAKERNQKIPMKVILKSINGGAIVTHDLTIIWYDNKSYLLDNNLFLELVNKSCELFCTLLYSHLQTGNAHPEGHYNFVVNMLIHYFSKVISFRQSTNTRAAMVHENKGFVYLKSVEGLGASELIKRGDANFWKNTILQDTLWINIVEEKLDGSEYFEESELHTLFAAANCAQIAEVLGLIKLAGHPTIEVEKGVQKLYDRTHQELPINPIAVNRSIAFLLRDLIKNFYIIHHKYPEIHMTVDSPSQAIKNLFNKKVNLSRVEGERQMMRIPLIDWADVILSKNAEFDMVDNQITLLKDKSLGLPRSKALQLLLSDNDFAVPDIGSMEERRALLHFLLSSRFGEEFTRYFDNFTGEEEWSSAVLEYLVIKLTPKELEEKPEGRMFGASPGLERNRRIVQEFNTMKFLSKYVPDQLLTPDELTTVKKLYSFRKLKDLYPDHTVFQVSFDFSKWNNSMRHESIDIPAAHILDRWYNINLYGKTMEAYENSLVYYRDLSYQRSWEGQLGGIEGLNQATWSYIFLGGIKQALSDIGVIYQVTVKGDDVRAAIAVPKQEAERIGYGEMRDHIMDRLVTLCADMGWQLNPQESFVSFSLICTSKQYQLHDTWLPASTKKIMKCESLSNLVFPTTEDIVSSVFSTAHSACAQTTNVIPAFSTAIIVASRIISRDLYTYKLTQHELTMLLCWPQILGGIGSLPLQTFIVRGENDMLSVSISLLRHILIVGDENLSSIAMKILDMKMEQHPNLRQFLSDPYSIPLKMPQRPSSVLKEMIRDNMKYWIINPDLKILISKRFTQDQQQLIDVLCSMNPMCPKLVAALYQNSAFYLIDEIVDKFMMSSTIFLFFKRGRGRNLSARSAHFKLRRVVKAAQDREKFWISSIRKPSHSAEDILNIPISVWMDIKNHCTTVLVQKIRDFVWEMRIVGLTYPSLVDQNMLFHPDDMMELNPSWDIRNITSHVHIKPSSAIYQGDMKSHHYSAVPGITPWIGAKTALKLMLPNIENDSRSPCLSKILTLLMIKRTGFYVGKTFQRLVNYILSSLTGVDTNKLNVLMPEGQGGHIAHRVKMNSFSLNTMPNYRPNIAQLVKLNEESAMILKCDTRNRTINFAAKHYYLIVLSTFELQFSEHLNNKADYTYYSVIHNDENIKYEYVLCEGCAAIVDDEELSLTGVDDLDLSHLRDFKLIGTTETEEKILNDNINSAIIGKARRLLSDNFLDPTNYINLIIASAKVITSEFKSSVNIFNTAQAASSRIIPRHELLEVVKTNWIGGSSLQSQFSLKLWRCIPANLLYLSLLQECFQFYIEIVGVDWDLNEQDSIDLIQAHLNPIATVFERLITASLLYKVSVGCRLCHYITDPLIWPPSTVNNPHNAATLFINYHKGFFNEIITNDNIEMIPKLTFYVNMESDETIQSANQCQAEALMTLCLHRMNRKGVYGRPLDIFAKALRRYTQWFINDKEDDEIITMLTNNDIINKNDDINNLEGPFELLKLNEEDFTLWLNSKFKKMLKLPEFEYVIDFETIFVRLYGILLSAINIIYGDWVNWTTDNVRHMTDSYRLVISGLYSNNDALDQNLLEVSEGSMEDNIIYSKIKSRYGINYLRHLVSFFNYFIFSKHCTDNFMYLLGEVCDRFDAWLKCVNYRRLCIMSNEDAERILKAQIAALEFIDDADVHTSSLQKNIQAIELPPYIDICTYQRKSHENGDSRYYLRDYNIGDDNYLLNMFSNLKLIQHKSRSYNQFIDLSYYFNLTNSINWTASRLLECITTCHIVNWLNSSNQSHKIMCLGDGTGGCSKLVLELIDNSIVLYCSLYYNPGTGFQADDSTLSMPPYEFQPEMTSDAIRNRVIWTGFYPGDVNDRAVQGLLTRKFNQLNGQASLFISDAELPYKDYTMNLVTYMSNFFKIFLQCAEPYSVIVFKFQLIIDDSMIRLLTYLRMAFVHFHVFRPRLSRIRVNEAYLVLSELRFSEDIISDLMKVIECRSVINYNFQINNDLNESITMILEKRLEQQQCGYNNSIKLQRFFHLHKQHVTLIRPLILYLNDLNISRTRRITHFCEIFMIVTQVIDAEALALSNNWRLVREGQPKKRVPTKPQDTRSHLLKIMSVKNKAIAEYASTRAKLIEDIINNTILRVLVEQSKWDIGKLIESSKIIMPLVIMQIYSVLYYDIDEGYVTIEEKGFDCVILFRNNKIGLKKRLRNITHLFMKLLGAIDYIDILIRENNELVNFVVERFIPECQLLGCCRQQCLSERSLSYMGIEEIVCMPIFTNEEIEDLSQPTKKDELLPGNPIWELTKLNISQAYNALCVLQQQTSYNVDDDNLVGAEQDAVSE